MLDSGSRESDPRVGGAPEIAGALARGVRKRWRSLARTAAAVREALKRSEDAGLAESVHALRIAVRRLHAAIGLHASEVPPAVRKRLKSLRRAAGAVRDCDVHEGLLRAAREVPSQRAAADAGLARLAQDREAAREALAAELDRRAWRRGRLSRVSSSADAPTRGHPEPVTPIVTLSQRIERLGRAAGSGLGTLDNLHELRLAAKSVRYSLSELEAVRPSPALPPAIEALAELQRRLGDVNDLATLVGRIDRWAKEAGTTGVATMEPLRAGLALVRDARAQRAREHWGGQRTSLLTLLRAVGATVSPVRAPEQASQPVPPGGHVATDPAGGTGAPPTLTASNGTTHGASHTPARGPAAVIDIGSNSIRLLVVDREGAEGWRVLGEERAMTRLAQGLAATNQISAEAMARSVEAVGRFKAAAEKLGAVAIGAFATAAVRDADNGRDFLSLVQDRTGLLPQIVSARDEGSLTFRSVARVMDISHGDAVVVDLGGGSLEVVRSRDGVIIGNTSMKLGAVRLTEMFGGADGCAGPRYADLRAHIRRVMRERVGRVDSPPGVVVGCGGAFTTLLTLAAAGRGVLIDRNSPALASLGPVTALQVRDIVRALRKLPLEARLRVPGLPSDRADIIIAGLAVIRQVMKRLRVSEIRVHPGGVREGLLLRMVERPAPSQHARPAESLPGAARALLTRCVCDSPHAEHVTRLALSLYDQLRQESTLIPGLASRRDERTLLEAGSLLHDIGTFVEYRAHHKHGMAIIRHADLPGVSDADREVLALLARYHRRGAPKASHPAMAMLPASERDVVLRLAAILRVADGLDRRHAQTTRGVHVRFGAGELRLEADLPEDAGEDLEGASAKRDLLERLSGERVRVVRAAGQAAHAPPARTRPA
ncbi:MAG: CHAD domain-containing protein [Phycisphaerales bacterium]|nr:CHAD domain-containing protein [Phycisphaerales bacterium]